MHHARRRAPFGESAYARMRARCQQRAGDDFGRAVVVRHVKGVKTLLRVRGQLGRSAHRVQQGSAPLHVCHLPQAGDDARNLQARRKQRARRAQAARARASSQAHFILAWMACTSSEDICPTVTTSPLAIFQVRKGPAISPFLSNCTGPITPT